MGMKRKMTIKLEQCNKKVFDIISDHIAYGSKYFHGVTVTYNGSNTYGELVLYIDEAKYYNELLLWLSEQKIQ